jgi:hypothetical protein
MRNTVVGLIVKSDQKNFLITHKIKQILTRIKQ